MNGDAGGHLADRPEPEYGNRAAVGNGRVFHRLPRGWQNIGEVDEPLVRRPLRDLDRAELRLGNPQQLGLAAGNLPVELGVAEQRGALALRPHLSRLALRIELLVAHEAVAAGDV